MDTNDIPTTGPATATQTQKSAVVADRRQDTSGTGSISVADPPAAGRPEGSTSLLTDADGFRDRWDRVQTGFVDEPRSAVQQADALVSEVIDELSRSLAAERERLEGRWSAGEDTSTEDLRVALQRYRDFFDRLLTR